jgi:hypothetical protein
VIKPSQETEDGEEVEEAGLGVLLLGDPGYRLNLYRVQGPEGCPEPGSRDAEFGEDLPEQEGAGGVQEEVNEVVREGGQPPECVLQPEGTQDKGVVGGGGSDPDVDKA